METIEPPDTHHLSAAMGWMELGNFVESKAELSKVSPTLANHPTVLEVAWAVHASEGNWTEALRTAEQLVICASDRSSSWLHRAYALRRAPGGGLHAAWNTLLPVVDSFPEDSTIPYNLACYACQMEKLDEARRWLQRALAAGGKNKIKSMAAADPDLEPLWAEISKM